MEKTHHKLKLSSGRTLSYYIFRNERDESNEEPYPILYFHGFPGSGIEGGLLTATASQKIKIIAPDRPGFGNSDPPLPAHEDSEQYIHTFVQSVWELVKHEKLAHFSIIGVSGGGPYTLAFLASYLKEEQNRQSFRLEAVSIVAGAYFPAGVDDMMRTNQQIYQLSTKAAKGSIMARAILRISTSINYYILQIPKLDSFMRILPMFKDLPQSDRDVMMKEDVFGLLMEDVKTAYLQGSSSFVTEAIALFRDDMPFEEDLKENYSSDQFNTSRHFPKVSIFHGLKDVNVPVAHSRYVHEKIFNKSSSLFEYPEIGHISLVVEKSHEYISSVLPNKELT